MNQFPPKPLSILLGLFQIFLKIRGDIRSSRYTTGVVDAKGKWKKSSNWKLFCLDIKIIFFLQVHFTVYTINIFPIIDTGGKFSTGDVDTSGTPWLANISEIFEKNLNDHNDIFSGLGEDDSLKNLKQNIS